MKQQDMFGLVRDHLAAVETKLGSVISSQDDYITDIGGYLLKAGGKRIRPGLYLLCARPQGAESARVLATAVAIEMIHMATLVHDDVIDCADTRRGIATANARWGNHPAVLAGDYLFARAFSLLAQEADGETLGVLTSVISDICEGEIAQTRHYFNPAQNEDHYLDRIAKKTARFIAASCQLGAKAAGFGAEDIKSLYDYGYAVGMAFQITDDILDVTGTPEEIGKPAGNDLRQGVLTLPVLYALSQHKHKEELKKLILAQDMSDHYSQRCLAMIQDSEAIDYSYNRAKEYLSLAIKSLPGLLAGDARAPLLNIAEFIGLRKY